MRFVRRLALFPRGILHRLRRRNQAPAPSGRARLPGASGEPWTASGGRPDLAWAFPQPLEGYWFDRTQEYAARQRREPFDRLQYASQETLTLDPLPCWKHLDPEPYRRRVANLVEEIEEQASAARRRSGVQVLGPAAIRAQHPHTRPEKLKKGPAPLFHAFTKEMRQLLYEGYRLFVAAFRDAAEALRQGNLKAPFPKGCFPPALPFVGG